MLTLSHDMEIGCIVEGVETSEELDALTTLGGVLVQGYFYSAPVPEAEIAAFLPDADMSRKTA